MLAILYAKFDDLCTGKNNMFIVSFPDFNHLVGHRLHVFVMKQLSNCVGLEKETEPRDCDSGHELVTGRVQEFCADTTGRRYKKNPARGWVNLC